MKLLYISTFLFHVHGKKKYGLPANADAFFQKYLDVFSEVRVLGDPMKSYLDKSALVEMTDSRISVRVLKSNQSPADFMHDAEIKRDLIEEIQKAEAILIKPTTRKGMMAERIARKYNKPFMIEMTGDIHNALSRQNSFLKKAYAPLLYYQIKRNMRDCQFGLYVSQDYLQKKYPIKGLMCGCSDVNIGRVDENIIDYRIKKIEEINIEEHVDIALIGFYQGLMKGIDTAIRALAKLPPSFHLHILGNGTEENRNKWYKYAQEHGVTDNRIHFPAPLTSSGDVMKWLDTMDIFVLPTLSEGLPRCMVEALSRGLICFGTNVCTLPELLPEECLHDVGDDSKLSELIMQCCNSKKTMQEMALRNFEKSKEFELSVLKERRNTFLNKYKDYITTECKR